jgi:hypothetical protein
MLVLSILQLIANSLLVFTASAQLIRLPFFRFLSSPIDRSIGLFVLCAAQVVLAGSILGYAGILSLWSFSLFHVSTVILLLRAQKNTPKEETPDPPRNPLFSIGKLNWEEKVLGAIIVTVLLATAVFASAAPPVDFDSLGYRLSRIGMWLQENSIAHTSTTDPRMNYSAKGGDLLQLWVVSHFEHGYPLVGLVQWLGGILITLSTYQLGRLLGLSRVNRLFAIVLLLGMPVVISQMTTEQVDVLVAAFFITSIYLLLKAFQKGADTWIGWIAFALALSVKGTVFYLVPGLMAMALIWAFALRLSIPTLLKQSLPFLVCITILCAPRHIENYWNYGNAFADSASLSRLRGDDSQRFSYEQVRLNLLSHVLQLMSPSSNRPLPQSVLVGVAEPLIVSLPEELDPYSLSTARRPYFAGNYLGLIDEIPPLMGSSGLVSALLASVGLICLLRQAASGTDRRENWIFISLGLLIPFSTIFFYTNFQWSPYTFRFFILVLPVLSLLAASWLKFPTPGMAACSRLAIGAFCLCSAFFTLNASPGVGMQALINPGETLASATHQRQLEALSEYVPEGSKIAVSLPYYAPLSSFFRNPRNYDVVLVPSSERKKHQSPEALISALDCHALISNQGFWHSSDARYRFYSWSPGGDIENSHAFAIWIRKE